MDIEGSNNLTRNKVNSDSDPLTASGAHVGVDNIVSNASENVEGGNTSEAPFRKADTF